MAPSRPPNQFVFEQSKNFLRQRSPSRLVTPSWFPSQYFLLYWRCQCRSYRDASYVSSSLATRAPPSPAGPFSFGRRLQTDDAALGAVCEQVEEAVGALLHVADPFVELAEIALLQHDLVALQRQPHQPARLERADEQAAVPAGIGVAGVEDGAGRRDHRIPIVDRLLHAGLRRALADRGAGIVDPVGDDRPAIVLSRLRVIELVAAARAVLHGPETPGLRMESGGLHVAVAVGPDLRARAGATDEGIVARDRSIGVEAHDLAEIDRKVLGGVAMAEALALGDEQRAVAREDQPRSEMQPSVHLRLLAV